MTSRILVVDDNPINLALVDYVLVANGFVVAVASTAEDVRELVVTFGPDLILMDIQIPGTSGVELMQQIKLSSSSQHIVIVAFTAYAMQGDAARFKADGFDGYLAKPFDIATFPSIVMSYLQPKFDISNLAN